MICLAGPGYDELIHISSIYTDHIIEDLELTDITLVLHSSTYGNNHSARIERSKGWPP